MGSDSEDPLLRYQLEVLAPNAKGVMRPWATELVLFEKTGTRTEGAIYVPKASVDRVLGLISALSLGGGAINDFAQVADSKTIDQCLLAGITQAGPTGHSLSPEGLVIAMLQPDLQKAAVQKTLLKKTTTRFGLEFHWNTSEPSPVITNKEGSQREHDVALHFVRETLRAYSQAITLDNAGKSLNPARLTEISEFESQMIIKGHIRRPHTVKVGERTIIREGSIVNRGNLSKEDLDRAVKIVSFWNEIIPLYSRTQSRAIGFAQWLHEATLAQNADPKAVRWTPVGRRFGRDIIRVQTPDGWQPFYRSTGHNSGMPGTWLPFDGVSWFRGSTWFDKGRFTEDSGPLERFGTPALKELSDKLGSEEIPQLKLMKIWDINEELGYTMMKSILEMQERPKDEWETRCNRPTDGEVVRANKALHDLMQRGGTEHPEWLEILSIETGADGRPIAIELNRELDIPQLTGESEAGKELITSVGAAQALLEEHRSLELDKGSAEEPQPDAPSP